MLNLDLNPCQKTQCWGACHILQVHDVGAYLAGGALFGDECFSHLCSMCVVFPTCCYISMHWYEPTLLLNNAIYVEKEQVKVEEGCLEKIMELSGGDMRRAVTFLQSCFQLSGGTQLNLPITIDIVVDISGDVRLFWFCNLVLGRCSAIFEIYASLFLMYRFPRTWWKHYLLQLNLISLMRCKRMCMILLRMGIR